ncbi:MAG: Mu transposase C-terminal domain-containing protein [Syntrophobacteraceae bacterium]
MKSQFTVRELASTWGIHERSIQRILAVERVPFVMESGKRIYHSKDFTPKIQKLFLKNCQLPSRTDVPLFAHTGAVPTSLQTDSTCIPLPEDLLKDPRVQCCSRIVREATNVPGGWKVKKWVECVARKNGIYPQTVYNYIAREKHGGLAAHRHTKSNKGKPKIWDERALEFGIGLALKREHRKMTEKAIYDAVRAEAALQGWSIGGYRSFTLHLKKKMNPLLLAIRDGGKRGLDNLLPPILRNYTDLAPFEIVVGDQHKFDFWVQDDETGVVFRPEGYFFQDLRTRLIYGLWLGRRYNGHAIGLALRSGCRCFGAFKSVYTDNGRPELSTYLTGIVNEMAASGLSVSETVDLPVDLDDQDPEEVACLVVLNHRTALVRNAKAKMIESTFRHFEAVLRDEFKVPGHVKCLSASGEEQEVDELEIKKLATAGKLLKFSEFLLTVVQAADFYNKERPHRGVLKEWIWKPRPTEVTPLQCLRACHEDGWRPVRISEDALDLLFLFEEKRTVDRGRIRFRTSFADLYEHPALAALHGQKVSIRFDPLDPGWILVFANSEFVCRAIPVEYSSMKDMGLAKRKIEEKARLRKYYLSEYQRLTSQIPDLIEYSAIPTIETVAQTVRKSIIAADMAEKAKIENQPSDEQLAAEIREKEEFEIRSEEIPIEISLPVSDRPFFEYEEDRFKFLLNEINAGASLSDDEFRFIERFRAVAIARDTWAYWGIYAETKGLSEKVSALLQAAN